MSMHPLYRVTHIGRPVEPKYPTNLAVLVLMPLIGALVAALRWQHGAPLDNILAGFFLAGLTVFLTWALGRELAPDDNPAAFVAVAGVSAPLLAGLDFDLGQLALAVALARVVNRTVGPPARVSDCAAVSALVTYEVLCRGLWPLAWIAALAFLLDARLRDPSPRSRVVSGLSVVLGLVGLSLALGPHPELVALAPTPTCAPLVCAAVVVAALFLVVIATHGQPKSKCDIIDWTVCRERVRGGMLIVLLIALLSLAGGDAGVQAVLPLWAAMAGVVMGRAIAFARGR